MKKKKAKAHRLMGVHRKAVIATNKAQRIQKQRKVRPAPVRSERVAKAYGEAGAVYNRKRGHIDDNPQGAWVDRGSGLYSMKEWATIRRMVASNKLDAMITSPPMCNRSTVDETVWAKKAIRFADALLKELDK